MRSATPKKVGRPRIVILGAGFAGLWAARELARHPFETVLVDRNNYHTFLPLLYQIAASEVEPEEIVYPVRAIFRGKGSVRFQMTDATGVDLDGRVVRTSAGDLPYDYLVVALGSVPNFFGIPGAAEHSFPLKAVDDGIAVRNRILERFEAAQNERDVDNRRRMLTVAIVGGGATGVEFAGAYAELVRGPLAKDYGAGAAEARIVLLEAQERLLGMLPERLSGYARKRLEKLGVEVRTGAVVARITGEAVELKDGTTLPAETVVWTSGVQAAPMMRAWGLPQGPGGRVTVLPTLQVEGRPEVYVAGDLAGLVQDGQPLPMVAPAAVQQGRAAARNIAWQEWGMAPEPFRYRDPGAMVTIGRNAAVASLHGWNVTGFSAWLLWLFVHIANLIGFRNRLFVLTDWAMDYFFFERSARVILADCRKCKT